MKLITTKHGDVRVDAIDFDRIANSNWNVGTHRMKDDYIHVRAYKKVKGKSTEVSLSRFITNAPKGKIVTFKNKDTLDLRKLNLIVTTHSGKRQNSISNKLAKSSMKGVYVYGDRFLAQIRFDGRSYHIGMYEKEEDAGKAYDVEALKTFQHPRLNFPDDNMVG